jgi:hypothetical protein
LEVIGFDKSGNLLLCQRDQHNKVDGKYLIDCRTGKVVGRTKPGAVYEVWERCDDDAVGGVCDDTTDGSVGNQTADGSVCDETAAGRACDEAVDGAVGNNTADGLLDRRTGAKMLKDACGRVIQIIDCYEDRRAFERDTKGNLTQISITSNGETAIYKRGSAVAGVSNHFWYREPYNPKERSPGFQFEVLEDGTLIQQFSKDKTVIFKVNGAMIERQASGKELLLRRAFVRAK